MDFIKLLAKLKGRPQNLDLGRMIWPYLNGFVLIILSQNKGWNSKSGYYIYIFIFYYIRLNYRNLIKIYNLNYGYIYFFDQNNKKIY